MCDQQQSIQTFAILDVEVNDFHQHQFNQCSLTELCIYGFSAKCLQNDIKTNGRQVGSAPKLPRVMNRINIMVNPLRRIRDTTQTGLDNYMLENETSFDVDTADCILKFINRLKKPVCLVAHNGLDHDFRILRYVYEKINQAFPSSIYCVDSLDAFRKIDRQIDRWANVNKKEIESIQQTASSEPTKHSNDVSSELQEFENKNIDWQVINESTPKKKISTIPFNKQTECSSPRKSPPSGNKASKIRRQLQFDGNNVRCYKLGDLYKSVFKNSNCENCHEAEGDVRLLTELVLHYGAEFVKYAEANKQTFDQVSMLGAKNVLQRYPKKKF